MFWLVFCFWLVFYFCFCLFFGLVVLGSSFGGVVRGGFWLFVGQFIISVFGFLFWLVVSWLGGADVVGLVSGVFSLASLVSSLGVLGLNASVQRFVGRCRGLGEDWGVYVWSGLAVALASEGLLGFCLVAAGLVGVGLPGLPPRGLVFAGLLVVLSFGQVFNGFLTGHLRTEYIAAALLAANIVRIAVVVVLLWLGWGWLGGAAAMVLGQFASLAWLAWGSARVGLGEPVFSRGVARELVVAGLSVWAPNFLLVLGQSAGVLFVLGFRGGAETGRFYVALAIFTVVTAFSTVFVNLMMPVLSGMGDGRKRALWRAVRFSLFVAGAVSPLFVFYAGLPVGLFGSSYGDAALALSLLSLGCIPLVLVRAVNSLLYAYGDYWRVFLLGLALNGSRVALYVFLVPWLGGVGAALSYLAGSVAGFTAAFFFSMVRGFRWCFRDLAASFAGFPVAAAFYFAGLRGWVGFVAASLAVLVVMLRVGLVTRGELEELGRGFGWPLSVLFRVLALGAR